MGPVKAGSPTNPGAMGFDEWLSHDNFFEMNPTLSRNGGPPRQFQGESSKVVIDEAIRFIGKAKQDRRPFFSVVWFGSPHEPYSGLDQDLALYSDLPEEFKERFARVTDMERGVAVERRLDKVLQARFAEITAMDRAIGQLRKYLKDEGLRQNTLLWYCGDNGVPAEGHLDAPLRRHKGFVYDGGVRVPGLIEWPERIPEQRVTGLNAVTSDMLPTICDLVGEALPDRPLDGISLKPLIDGGMTERSEPICFWSYNTRRETQGDPEPYIDPELQEGTTPLVKMMDGRFTRNFRNFHHPRISEDDYDGPRAILDNRYKLVVDGQPSGEASSTAEDEPSKELFDLRTDQAEQNNLIEAKPEMSKNMEKRLRDWQRSVLESLTGADYE